MGNFYTNITLRGPGQDEVAAVLSRMGREALVSPSVNGFTTVFDAECEMQDTRVLAALTADLSSEFACPALAVLNHDDSVFFYELYSNGKLIDTYNSAPDYFDSSGTPSAATGGNAEELCSALGAPERVAEVQGILRRSALAEDGYVFEIERHQALVLALGLPALSVAAGYTYLSQGELPEGISPDDLKRTG
jgi:hypothetical protein